MLYRAAFPLVIALLAGPAFAKDEPAASAAAPAKASDSRVVCRTDNEIGSMVRKKKICMTIAEWRDLQYRTGSAVERRSTGVSLNGGG